MSGPYGLYMYALKTWYMLYGHKRCLLVGEEYMAMEDVFLLVRDVRLQGLMRGDMQDFAKYLPTRAP